MYGISAIGVVIFATRLGTLDADLSPDSEAQRFVDAANLAFDTIHKTTMYWPLHKKKNTKAWHQLCESLDYIWE